MIAAMLAAGLGAATAACPDGRSPNVTVNARFDVARLRQAWAKAGLRNAARLTSAITYMGVSRSCFGGNRCVIWIGSDRSTGERARDLAYEMKNACGRADPQRWMMEPGRWLPDPRGGF